MITQVVRGDLFESQAQTWVNAVNTVGVMGKGIALSFKRRFPDMYLDYQARCREGQVRLGEPYLFRREKTPWIINFPTKADWHAPSSLDAVEAGLRYLAHRIASWGVESLAVPALGCGLGQLAWSDVAPLIHRHLHPLSIPVDVYEPLS